MNKKRPQKIICSISEAIKLIKKGEILILVDDKNRENEGDLFFAAELVTAKKVNFLITHGKGLVCLPITEEKASKLSLPLMVPQHKNQEFTRCNFTVSIDARQGIGSGISAFDRARTIKLLASSKSRPDDFVRPGHIFPLVAEGEGLIKREGHTEAAVELTKLAGLSPVGVICELIDKNGQMMRLPSMLEFAKKHRLRIVLIKDLIEFLANKKNGIDQVSETTLVTNYGRWVTKVFVDRRNRREHLALIYQRKLGKDNLLVRIHSQCLTSEVFGSLKCDCRDQLKKSLKIIAKNGSGIIIYLNQEGRGIGLSSKIMAYHLQEKGLDTVEANKALGFSADERDFQVAAEILKHLGLKKIRLLTNNPAKVQELQRQGILVSNIIPLQTKPTKYNRAYLRTKKEKLAHLLEI